VLVAKLEGARVVLAGIEKDKCRMELAKSLGVDNVVNASRENLVEVVRSMSKGEGADVVFECAGDPASLDVCLDAVRKGGTVVQAGVYPSRVETEINRVMMKELSFIGTYGYVWTTWPRSLRLLAEGKIDTEAIVSHEFPLHRFEEAFRTSQERLGTKVIFNPQAA